MSAIEVGRQLVELFNHGKSEEAMESLYAAGIVSIEAFDSPELPARIEGLGAVRKKASDWFAVHEVHSERAVGPFCGNRPDQFAVFFEIDVTDTRTGNRSDFREVALYTVAGGRIVEESFLYLMP